LITPRKAPNNKVLVIYDQPQHQDWIDSGVINKYGLKDLLKGLTEVGIELEDVSVICLSDYADGKAAGFKEKAEYVDEFIGSYAPNLLLFATAKAFELCMGSKGASKFYGRIIQCEKYQTKALTIPPYSMVKHNPDIVGTIKTCLELAKREMQFPELIEEEREPRFYTLVDTIEKFRAFYAFYKENVFRYALDIETSALQFNQGKVLTIQFSHKANYGYCIPTPDYHGNWTAQEWAEIVTGCNDLIDDDSRMKIGANIYFDFKHLAYKYKTKLCKHNVYDVLIASFLCDENRESHSLKYCAATLLDGFGDYDAPLELFKSRYCKEHKIKKTDFTYDLIPLEVLFPYSCMDVDASIQLADYFDKQLEIEEQVEVFKDVSTYAYALARIEQCGWKVDLPEAERYKAELEERIESLGEELKTLPEIQTAVALLSRVQLEKENAKRKNAITELKKPLVFLVNSVNHKRFLFKDVLKFPQIKKTKKGEYSTDKESFLAWAEQFPDVGALRVIKEMEGLKKMLSTYVLAIINRSVDSRIHCSFRVASPKTGRISCVAPNMQNIAMHSEEAQKLKKCFISEEGTSLVVADLSNAELRITAAISKDPAMVEGFKNGLDPHSNTAREVFKLDCEVHEIKEKYNNYRQIAKTLGFAALYGAAPALIAKNAGISVEEAQKNLAEYFAKHYGIRQMLQENVMFAREHGYAVAVSGRKRRVPHIDSEDEGLRARAERQANNFIIQSVASDGMLQSLVNMWAEIDERGLPFKIINVIHDSCEMEVPDSMISEAHEFIVRHLSRWPKGLTADFPMKADAEVGKTWADLKEFDLEWVALAESEEEDSEESEDDMEDAA